MTWEQLSETEYRGWDGAYYYSVRAVQEGWLAQCTGRGGVFFGVHDRLDAAQEACETASLEWSVA